MVGTLGGEIVGSRGDWDVVLAGVISYERCTASRIADWLEALAQEGKTGLIGDPGRSCLASDRLVQLATYEVAVTRALEDADVKRSSVFCFRAGRPS